MFKVIQTGANRLELEMSGELEAEEIKIVIAESDSQSENIENRKMLHDVIDFRLPPHGVFSSEFSECISSLTLPS